MIPAITTRRVTIDGTGYSKGDAVKMPAGQFADLGPDGVGVVKREPVRPAAEPRTASKIKG